MRPLWLAFMVLLLALFAANHVEFHLYVRSLDDEPSQEDGVHMPVKTETGEDGHLVVLVSEKDRPTVDAPWLNFSELGKWNRDPSAQTPPPESLARLDGKRVVVAGFMS
ncbi:MAG: hypothetical protein ACYTFG_04550, partial [Planctomycetota bacterium]